MHAQIVAEKYLRASGLDYTIVRPGGLKVGRHRSSQSTQTGTRPSPSPSPRRAARETARLAGCGGGEAPMGSGGVGSAEQTRDDCDGALATSPNPIRAAIRSAPLVVVSPLASNACRTGDAAVVADALTRRRTRAARPAAAMRDAQATPPTGELVVAKEDTLNAGEVSRDLVADVVVAALFDGKGSNKVVEIVEGDVPKLPLDKWFA